MSTPTQLLNNLREWWDPAGLLVTNPPIIWKLEYFYIGFVALCLALGIVILILPLHRGLKSRLSNLLWTNVILGAILYTFRSQRLPILGMDLWRFMQELGTVIWVVAIFLYWKRQHPKVVLSEQVATYKSKYLPKPKK